jgi:hypothetical protein
LAKRKADAKKDGAVALKPDRDIKPTAASGTNPTNLQVHLAHEVAQTLWLPDGLGEDEAHRRLESAVVMLKRIKPQGILEGMLAAQMVATHEAAMECLRRAMHEGQALINRDHNLKHAAKFLALYTRQLEALDKHRGKGQQKITVEHINIEPGGQAIVGHVETGRGPKCEKGPATAAIDHAPEVPLEIPDPVTPRKTPQKTRRGR